MEKKTSLTEKGATILKSAALFADAVTGKAKIQDIVDHTGFSKQQVIGSLRGLYHSKNGVMAKCDEKGYVVITEKGWKYFTPVEEEVEEKVDEFANEEEESLPSCASF